MTQERVQVAIVGAGPVGATIANLLGAYGVRTVLIDRSAEILPYPRAVGMDDEALRLFQSVGLAEPLLDDMIQNLPLRMFDGKGRQFADIRPRTREYGWFRRNIFMQQLAEKTLRDGLARYANVQVRLGVEVTGIAQDEEGVSLALRDERGELAALDADYCVAADGGRSTLRECLGVALSGTTHPIKWLVVDVRNVSVDAPFTALHCDPRRPHVCIHLPFGYRRWEFMVFPDEDEATLCSTESVRELLRPHVGGEALASADIVRSRIYTHHSRVAERFVVGRTVLVGDAAHLSPPWIGQGLNAGLRDAGNVAWKLAAIVRGAMHPRTLSSYEDERRAHAVAMIDLADTFGRILMPTSRVKAGLRDLFFRYAGAVPGVRDYVLEMRFKPMPSYAGGLVAANGKRQPALGRMFIQPDVECGVRSRARLDDVLGNWFAIVGWRTDPFDALDDEARAFWQGLGATFVRVERSRSGSGRDERLAGAGPVRCVEDVDNAFETWFAGRSENIVVLRPDRYVAALVAAHELNAATADFRQRVH